MKTYSIAEDSSVTCIGIDCLVCGELIAWDGYSRAKICDKCRNAILFIRKHMIGDDMCDLS